LGLSYATFAMIIEELSRGWMSVVGPIGTHSVICDIINRFGTEEQKRKYLPGLASGERRGGLALSEADAGTDVQRISTVATRVEGGYLINGSKMWITNGTLADVAIVWAQTDDGIRGFVVPTDAKGFSAHKIQRKLSLRASVTAELAFDDLRLPADAAFPEVRGLKGPLSCLNEARYGIVWGVVGAARACLEESLAYTSEREQFGKPLASFQLTQRKLALMTVAVNNAALVAWRLGALKDAGTLTPIQVSYGKYSNVRAALDVAREARTTLGGAGITLDHSVMRHMNNLETVMTYEGTEEMHLLSVGSQLTGIPAFR
jgi:glutaryl-CoA dehydrogenase